jgi:thioesterase domain-containing protein
MTRVKEGSGTPFLFCHGDWGRTQGLYAFKLADMLTCNQPVYLLHPYPNPDPKLTIEEMARAYLSHVLAAQPTGAFRLGGACNGGLLAWEIACQLDRIGREVEAIVLLDTMSVNARPVFRAIANVLRFIAVVVPKRTSEKLKVDGMRAIWGIGRGMRAFSRTGKWNWSSTPALPVSRANSNYVPPKLRTRVFCVICEESRKRPIFSSKPWINLAPEVQCEYVPGTHLSFIREHVGEVARALDKFLRATGGSIGV